MGLDPVPAKPVEPFKGDLKPLTLGGLSAPAIAKTWENQIIGIVDDLEDMLSMGTQYLKHKKPLGVVAKLQTTESAEELAKYFLEKGVTTLVTDNDMIGTKGTDLILAIAKLDPERAKQMTFVLYTGLVNKARCAFDNLNKELEAMGIKPASIEEKPGNLWTALPKAWES